MASSEDNNFSVCSLGRSKAQLPVGKILGTIPAPPPHHDGETFLGRSVEKRPLLNFDLNVAPPEDGGSESPAADDGGNHEEILPTAAADVNENKDGIEAHWSKGGKDEKGMKSKNIVADSELQTGEKDRKIRVWNTLLEVAKNALLEHQQNRPIKGGEFQNPKRKPSQESELGGELTRRKITGYHPRSFAAEWNDETEAAPPVVVRSTRGRAVAMPNKYRDSVLDAAAELPRHNKSGKSAAVARKTR